MLFVVFVPIFPLTLNLCLHSIRYFTALHLTSLYYSGLYSATLECNVSTFTLHCKQYTQWTVFTVYSVQYTQCTVFTLYSIHIVQYTQCTVNTEYNIHSVQY